MKSAVCMLHGPGGVPVTTGSNHRISSTSKTGGRGGAGWVRVGARVGVAGGGKREVGGERISEGWLSERGSCRQKDRAPGLAFHRVE